MRATGENLHYSWTKDGVPIEGRDEAMIVVPSVTAVDAGVYQAHVAGPSGGVLSEPITLSVITPPSLGVSPGGQRIVAVPGRLAYYDLYLPSNYNRFQVSYPVLLTLSPGGGGLVGHFRQVAEEKQWIVIGISQSRNGQGSTMKYSFIHEVLRHALDNLRIDPNRIFVSGMSGGGWGAFEVAKQASPLVAGVFSMGGWLGNQHSPYRDMYLPGLQVARANGDSDTGANYYLPVDRSFLLNYLEASDFKDRNFPGGHVMSPADVQREVFDWFLSRTKASNAGDREAAKLQESHWKARVTAGEAAEVHREVMAAAFGEPRTARALAAMRVMDFMLARPMLFLREPPDDFASHPRRNYMAANLYFNLYAYMQHRDPSRQISATAAAMTFGQALGDVQWAHETEARGLLRHSLRTAFDLHILEHSLHDRTEPPYSGDWDGDGRDNFTEFVLGSDPLTADPPPSAEIRLSDGEVLLRLPGSRTGPMLSLEGAWADDPSGSWTTHDLDPRGFQLLADGRSRVVFSAGARAGHPRRFHRFNAKPAASLWNDGNGDGIPSSYQFPQPYFWEYPLALDTETPDSRFTTDVPGGAPLYLRYLAAAEIGSAGRIQPAYRYHPALAGYRGALLHETWLNVPGTTLNTSANIMSSREPNDVRLITTTQAPWYVQDSYHLPGENTLERTRGFVVASESGDHVFSIAGDDYCELWLSPTGDPAAKVRIARAPSYTGFQDYTQNEEQTSAPIPMQAGVPQYVEILHKQGGGGGHCSVSWIPPGETGRQLIPAANLASTSAGPAE